MKQTLLLITGFLLFGITCGAQYYYNDIIGTQQSNTNYQLLRSNKVRKVSAISKDAQGEVVDGFLVRQEISNDGSRITTSTSTSDKLTSELVSYFENGRVVKTEEKTGNVNTTLDYVYDASGRLQAITSVSFDTVINGYSKEEHIWQYGDKGQPTEMLKVKNGKDTINIVLIYDEKGVLAAEQWRKRNMKTETYYYYFDAGNRVTDIVRLNDRNGKMLPDWLYEYDSNGKLVKMTQVRAGGTNYLVWKYAYNEQGLKVKEAAFDKAKRLLGIMEYSYN